MSDAHPSTSHWLQYLAARYATTLLQMMPLPWLEAVAGGVGELLYRLSSKHRDRALAHLRAAFPEKTDAEHRRIARASMRHFLRVAVEAFVNFRLVGPTNWQHYVSNSDRIEQVLADLKSGESAILLTGHFGNWELLGASIAMRGAPLHAIARPIDNPLIDRWLSSMRCRYGLRLISKRGASDEAARVLEDGDSLGIVADQNGGRRGTFVPFFGRLASTHKSVALLAMRYRVPIHVGYCARVGRGYRFRIDYLGQITPEQWEAADDPIYYITARWVRLVEEMVREQPEQYLWMHRRWRSRPRWEQRGKPMPRSMRRKLSGLPWLTEDDVAKLSAAAAVETD